MLMPTREDEWRFSVSGLEILVGKRGKVLDRWAALDDQASGSLLKNKRLAGF